jgi:tRNA dimethylallyltransferase
VTALVAVVGPTASGKTALGLALARACAGEVVSCDSTAVYRGLDIGTDKPSAEARGAIPHHLIDIADPTEVYSAARYASDAAAAIHAIAARGHLPILVGGTGFYYRALVRGLFPGPPRDEGLRMRLGAVARRRGVDGLHRWLARVDPASGRRIQPRDLKRIVRALEVYLVSGRSLTDHFPDTVSPIAGMRVVTLGLSVDRQVLAERVSRRVEHQFTRGVVEEVRTLVGSGVPLSAHAFGGLVYRQIVEMLQGSRDESATKALIVRENLRYAKRQMVWFRKEADVHWFETTAGVTAVEHEALAFVRERL